MIMIIYMYLTIIVIFSILTGIITTIIEKKGLQANVSRSVVQSVDAPKKVIRVQKKVEAGSIPVIYSEQKFSQAVDAICIPQTLSNSSVELLDDYSEPALLGVVDDEII